MRYQAASVRDVTDEKASLGGGISGTSGCNFSEPSSIQRCYLASIPRGREIGLEMTFRF